MVRLAIVGCTGVGKSSIILQLMGNTWEPTHFQTVLSEAYILNYVIGNETIRLELEDTKGFDTTDRIEPLADEHNNSSELIDVVRQAYIVPFDICDRRTFKECEDIIRRVKQNFRDFHIPPIIYLVANKIDVADRRVIPDEESRELATKYGVNYAETSARLNKGIKELFDSIIIQICSIFRPYSIKDLSKFGVAQIPAMQKSGWVQKKNFFGFFSKRYAVLSGRNLFLYKSDHDSSPASVHPLRGAQISRDTSTSQPGLLIEVRAKTAVASSSSDSSQTSTSHITSLYPLSTYSIVLRFSSFAELAEWEQQLLSCRFRSITFDYFIHSVPANFGFPCPDNPPSGYCLPIKDRKEWAFLKQLKDFNPDEDYLRIW